MRIRELAHPSTVVSILALVCATGGVGYAAAKITSADIKDSTIQSKDVKDGSLAAKDLSAAARASLAGRRGPTGTAGLPGPAGTAGAVGRPGTDGQQGPAGAEGQRGPTGVAGVDGQRGPTGPAGIPGSARRVIKTGNHPADNTAIVTLTSLPAGSYVLTARTTAIVSSTGPENVTCFLKSGGAAVDQQSLFEVPDDSSATLAGQATITLVTAANVTYSCEIPGNDGHLEHTSLIAVQVSSQTSSGT